MAEDDEEGGFGDFKFATDKTHNSSSSNQMNGRNASVTDDDYDWGDFIDHSPQIGQGFQSANGFSFSQSSRNPSETSHLSDLFRFQSSGIEPGKEKWVKPQGALPLSIFGEEEVKEESSKSDSNTDTGEKSMPVKINRPAEKGINSNVDVGIDVMISSLFSKNQKIETGNTLIWNSNENSSNFNSNLNHVNPESPLYTSYNGWSLNVNDLNGANLSTELTSNSDLSFLEFNTNGVSFNNNNLSSNQVEADENFYEADDDDDDGWEFKAADMKATNGNENSEEQRLFKSSDLKLDEKLQIDQDMQDEPKVPYFHPYGDEQFKLNGTQLPSTMISHKSSEWDFGLNFNLGSIEKKTTMSDAHPQNKLNDMDKGPNNYLANENAESDDNFGEFSEAFLDQAQKDEPKVPYFHHSGEELFDINGTQTPSTMISHKSGEWDFGLNFNPGSVEKATTMSDAHPQNKLNDMDKSSNGYLANGNVESDDNFGEFSEAFPNQTQKDEPKVPYFHHSGEELFDINGTQTPSSMISHKSGERDFGLNFNPGFVEKATTMSDAHPQNKLNDMDKSPNGYLANGNVESDDNFGEFSEAFPDQTQKDLRKVPYFHPLGEELFNINGTETPSTMISHKSGERDFGLNFNPGSVVKETTMSDAHPQNKLNDMNKGPNSYPPYGSVESDDNFGAFSQAFPDQTQKINEELFANNQEDLPNFRDRKLQNHNILISQDISTFKISAFGNINQTTGSSTSIHDLISTLYHESEQKTSSDLVKAQNGEHINSTILETGVETDNDDFDEESWEFKDASPSFDVQDKISVIDLGNLPAQSSSKAELNDFVILYCKLKYYLSSLAFGLFENFEKAQSNTALARKDTKAEAIDEEIQKFMNDLMQDKVISDDVQSKSLSPSLDELLDLLQQPKFQVLESEYHLSNKLLMVEKDLTSAIELLRHATSTLRILESESVQKQSIYVSSWSKMLSVCAQELRHGVLIWNESLQNGTHSQILSEPQGRNNILALGEIYRVVKIIGASVKLYKPWTLLGYVDPTSFFSLLTECSILWSSSGLSEALLCISILNDFESKTLVDSIKYIQDLHEIALQNHLLSGEKSRCHLSALTVETVPGMNMVDWNGVQYFLKLANLWANLISRDPPFSETQM